MNGNLNISRKTYWLAGTGIAFTLGLLWLWWQKATNNEISENIMRVANSQADPFIGTSGAQYGDSRDLGISKIMSPGYWKTNPNKVTIWAKNSDGTDGPAMKFAKQIHDAYAPFQINPEPEKVVAVFRSLSSKEDVSKLADVFAGYYKSDLYSFLNGRWMTQSCDPEQDKCFAGLSTNYLKQVYDIIKKLN